jgi:hypothetical protein
MFGTVISATYVAIGTVEEVANSSNRMIRGRLTCRLDTVFKGNLRPGKYVITAPATLAVADDPKHKKPALKAGFAALMMVRAKGGDLRLISPRRGYFPLKSREEVAKVAKEIAEMVAKEKDLRRQGLVGDPSKRTSIQRTLQFWQTSWNANEVENVIACYSRKNKWRREWDSGFAGKRRIAKSIATFGKGGDDDDSPRAVMYVSLERIEERKKGREALATVNVNIVTRDQLVERQPAVMTFVFESGMWLILHEGN